MTMPFPKKPWIRGLLLAALCGTLVAVACWAPTPSEVTEPDAETQDVELPPPPITANEVEAAPTFTPFTVRPDIKNRGDVARALEEAYPPLLRDAGIGGTAEVWFFIDETGGVRRAQINESSGHEALDQAALEVARAVEFTPAMNKSEKVPVWISLPITFTIRGSASPKAEGREGEGGASVRLPPAPGDPEGEPWVRPNPEEVRATPTFTPYTVRPDIKNRRDVAQALEEAYPPLLREAGIGGTAHVWIFIDETGTVGRAQINESSGHEALDQAALEVARAIVFTPALNRDKKVPVWISLPITFTTR